MSAIIPFKFVATEATRNDASRLVFYIVINIFKNDFVGYFLSSEALLMSNEQLILIGQYNFFLHPAVNLSLIRILLKLIYIFSLY